MSQSTKIMGVTQGGFTWATARHPPSSTKMTLGDTARIFRQSSTRSPRRKITEGMPSSSSWASSCMARSVRWSRRPTDSPWRRVTKIAARFFFPRVVRVVG